MNACRYLEFPIFYNSFKLLGIYGEKLAEVCKAVDMPNFDGEERFWEKNIIMFLEVLEQENNVNQGIHQLRWLEIYPSEFSAHIPALNGQMSSGHDV